MAASDLEPKWPGILAHIGDICLAYRKLKASIQYLSCSHFLKPLSQLTAHMAAQAALPVLPALQVIDFQSVSTSQHLNARLFPSQKELPSQIIHVSAGERSKDATSESKQAQASASKR